MFSFQHFQFAGIHAGIQSGHCWVEMLVKYSTLKGSGNNRKKTSTLWNWAESHKTVSIRNGGDQNNLLEISALFRDSNSSYPWASWREDSSCNNCLTCVSIIVPERVCVWEPKYNLIETVAGSLPGIEPNNKLTGFNKDLYELITNTKHAQ